MELLNPRHLRVENYVLRNGAPTRIYAIEHRYKNNWLINDLKVDDRIIGDIFQPMPITKEILRDNLGFEISELADFWQCEREDFVLIQVKLSIGTMPYMFVLKSSIKESVNFYYVHHLQNTYLDLKGELLQWKS